MNAYQIFKERVRREVPIDSYVSRFVPLKRAGKSLIGLCPFHGEKTPSFHVNPSSGFFYCFGCKASGDIFRFVMDYQKVDFPKALEVLSEYSGIPIQERSGAWEEEERKKEQLLQCSQRANEYFVQNLLSPQGKEALEYLHSRGLSEEDIKIHSIGYALPGFNNLTRAILRNDQEIRAAESLGLLKRQEKSKEPYDFFRNRIMFPVRDAKGRAIAFSGRILGNSEEAKYINSPGSLLYDKGKTFYNLHLASDSIRKTREAIVVEGVFDAIGLYRKGLESVVAPLGTGFTEGHARILKNLCDTVFLMMDSDSAGSKGAFRAANSLRKEQVEVKIAKIPEGKDPFDYSQKHNKSDIRLLLDSAKPASQFMIGEVLEGASPASPPEKKQKGIQKLLDFIKSLEKETDKQVYLQEGAKQLGISYSAIFQDFIGATGKSLTPSVVDTSSRSIKKSNAKLDPAALCERKLMAKLVFHPELFSYAEDLGRFEFLDETSAFFWDYLYTKFLQNETIHPAEILSDENLPREYAEGIGEFLQLEDIENVSPEQAFKDLILQHEVNVYDTKMKQIETKMKESVTPEELPVLLSDLVLYKAERDKRWEFLRASKSSTV